MAIGNISTGLESDLCSLVASPPFPGTTPPRPEQFHTIRPLGSRVFLHPVAAGSQARPKNERVIESLQVEWVEDQPFKLVARSILLRLHARGRRLFSVVNRTGFLTLKIPRWLNLKTNIETDPVADSDSVSVAPSASVPACRLTSDRGAEDCLWILHGRVCFSVVGSGRQYSGTANEILHRNAVAIFAWNRESKSK